MFQLADVESALRRTAGFIRTTPIMELEGSALGLTEPIFLKLEQTQHTGSFKPRGVFNRVLATLETGPTPAGGLITASGGNAGLAVAYAASALRLNARIYVPTTIPTAKFQQLKALGAQVVKAGNEYADAFDAAIADTRSDTLFVHAYDHDDMCAGHGVIGIEMQKQLGNALDTVLVAVGGGGLMAGLSVALEGSAKVVAVESELTPTLNKALERGKPVEIEVGGVAADSLGARKIGNIGFAVAKKNCVTAILVSDGLIMEARRALWRSCHLTVEYGGATALAALLGGVYKQQPGERVAVLLCGANTDLPPSS